MSVEPDPKRVAPRTTYRVYVRWPGQRVSDKVVSQDRSIASDAFNRLLLRQEGLAEAGAYGIAFTVDGERIEYVVLNDAPVYSARRR